MKVLLNEEGKFLIFNKTSSHSVNIVNSYYWTSNINDASIIENIKVFDKLNWKGKMSPKQFIVAELNVKVVRTVTIVKE